MSKRFGARCRRAPELAKSVLESGKHYHPGHSFTYVLEGSEDYVLDGQPSRIVRPGDLLHEAPMQLHTVGNADRVKLLVLRVIDKGKEPTVQVP